MKASRLIEKLEWLISNQGDRDVWYLSLRHKGTNNETLLLEEVVNVHASMAIIDGEEKPHPVEPFTLMGNDGDNFVQEKLVKLNWCGRLIKRFIIVK